MAEPLENLAGRLEEDPFFLACSLKLSAKSAGLSDQQLADKLGCSMATLVLVRLCRAPGAEVGQFQRDIERIATRYQVDADILAEAVRRGQALFSMSRSPAARTLRAARDGTTKPTGGHGGKS